MLFLFGSRTISSCAAISWCARFYHTKTLADSSGDPLSLGTTRWLTVTITLLGRTPWIHCLRSRNCLLYTSPSPRDRG
eukprot:3365890-Amphidinium_carterae.1